MYFHILNSTSGVLYEKWFKFHMLLQIFCLWSKKTPKIPYVGYFLSLFLIYCKIKTIMKKNYYSRWKLELAQEFYSTGCSIKVNKRFKSKNDKKIWISDHMQSNSLFKLEHLLLAWFPTQGYHVDTKLKFQSTMIAFHYYNSPIVSVNSWFA